MGERRYNSFRNVGVQSLAIKPAQRAADPRMSSPDSKTSENPRAPHVDAESEAPHPAPAKPVEIGGRDGPDPTRYGDWEKNGRCIDF